MNTLTDRYVHAATRWLPQSTREEVAAELRERIDDTVAARADEPDAERRVLEDMGDPLKVMVEYTDREPQLIGPRYFYAWLRLLTLLIIMVPALAAAVTVVVAIVNDEPGSTVVGQGFATWFQVAVHVAFWTTLVFAVLEWTKVEAAVDVWSIDSLPDSTDTARTSDFIAQLVFLSALAAVIVWQAVASPIEEGGEHIALIDPQLWNWWVPLVLVLVVAEIAHAVWVYRSGWTWAAAGANAALGLAFAGSTVPLLLDGRLLNPDLVDHLGWDRDIVETSLMWVAVGVVLVTAWELVDGFLKARRDQSRAGLVQ